MLPARYGLTGIVDVHLAWPFYIRVISTVVHAVPNMHQLGGALLTYTHTHIHVTLLSFAVEYYIYEGTNWARLF